MMSTAIASPVAPATGCRGHGSDHDAVSPTNDLLWDVPSERSPASSPTGKRTTEIGYTNRNGQTVIERTELAGTLRAQVHRTH